MAEIKRRVTIPVNVGGVWIGGNHPIAVQWTIGRHEVRGKVHGGGNLLEVRTGLGDVEIK